MLKIKHFITFLLIVLSFSVIAQNSKYPEFNKSYAFFKTKNYDSALNSINSAIISEPQNIYFYIFKSKIFAAQRQYNYAISTIIGFQNQNSEIFYLLSQFYAYENNADSALFFLKKYLQTSYFEPKVEIINNKAYNEICKSTQWDKFWNQTRFSKHQELFNEAYNSFYYDNILDAIDQTNQLIKKFDKFYPAFELKADIMFKVKNYSEASKLYRKTLDLNPQNAVIEYKCGLSDFELQKFDDAAVHFNNSLNINPFQPETYLNLALALNRNKQYDEALIAIDNYLSVFDKDTASIYTKAIILSNSGDYLSSVAIINQLLKADKFNYDYYLTRGQSYLNSNSYEQAYYDFSQCLDINPTMTNVYFYRGQALYKMNKIQEACADWQNSLKYHDYRANKLYYPTCIKFEK